MNKLAELYSIDKIDIDYYTTEYDLLKKQLEEEENKCKINDIDTSKLENFNDKTFKILYNKLDNLGKIRFWRGYINKIIINSRQDIKIIINVD